MSVSTLCKNSKKFHSLLLMPTMLLCGAAISQPNDEVFTNRLIIKYKSGIAAVSQERPNQAALNSFKKKTGKDFRFLKKTKNGSDVVQLNQFHNRIELQNVINEIKKDGSVEYVEPDILMRPNFQPDDTYYSQYQWDFFEAAGGINVTDAWDVSTGLGAVVAVVDTGYLPHVDLSANLLPGYDMISDSFISRDGDGRDPDAIDMGDWTVQGECGNGFPSQDTNSSWHGTHVAGTVAALTNNGLGVAGVAFDAKILPVRAVGRCGGYTSDIADAIIWAAGGSVNGVPANPNPANVINLSLGANAACTFTFQNAVTTAHQNGSTVVVAAGNSNADTSNFMPANCNNVVTVAATNRSGGKAAYSNFGAQVDVAAPGGELTAVSGLDGILSTFNNGQTIADADAFAFYQGTSMATPHVSGVAALVYAANPAITPTEMEAVLKNTARNFPATCNQCGAGIIDATAAVAAANGLPDEDPVDGIALENGAIVTGLSGDANAELRFTIEIPENAGNLEIVTSGGTGDADLYVQFVNEPTTTLYDCVSYQWSSEESCLINDPQPGTYHVLVHGYAAFDDVNIVATWDENVPQGETIILDGLAGYFYTWNYLTLEVPAGIETLTFDTYSGTGNVDLYIKNGSLPTTSSYVCASKSLTTAENCTITNPAPGTWYIGLKAALYYSGVSLSAHLVP